MADEKEAKAQESAVFRVGDRLVDAWGREAQEDGVDYSTWNAKQLKAEIDRRNAERAEEDHIVLDDNKKSTAASALQADDEASDDEE